MSDWPTDKTTDYLIRAFAEREAKKIVEELKTQGLIFGALSSFPFPVSCPFKHTDKEICPDCQDTELHPVPLTELRGRDYKEVTTLHVAGRGTFAPPKP